MKTCEHGYTMTEPCRWCRPTERKKRAHNSTLPAPTKPINPVNRERRPAELERTYGPESRRKWVRMQVSVASGKWPCVNAHVKPPSGLPSGTGRKEDYQWIVPLTLEEERELHRIGERAFEELHGFSLADSAIETHERWLAHIDPDPADLEPDEDRLLAHRFGGMD